MNWLKKSVMVILAIACLSGSVLAVTIYTKLPGEPQTGTDIGGYVNYLYKFALMISGILAFGAIVYGGVKYTLAAGNPSGQSEGKEWVKGALTGLLLLAGAYTILNVINPNLVNWNLPKLTTFKAREAAPSTGGGGGGGGPETNAGQTYGCIAGNDKYSCSNSGTRNDCSDADGCSGRACFQLATALCNQVSGLTYACVGTTDQKYACSPTYRSNCSDSNGCSSPTPCNQITTDQCNTFAGTGATTTACLGNGSKWVCASQPDCSDQSSNCNWTTCTIKPTSCCNQVQGSGGC